MTINEEILDSTIRHMVWTERYKTSQVKKIVALLNRADDDLVEQIAARMVKIEARGYDLGPATTERLESLLKSIREQRAEIAKTIYETSRDELFEFAAYEADFQSRIITGSVAQAGVTIEMVAPSASQLKSAVTKKPFQGRLLRDWYRDFGASSAKRVSDAVNIGIVEGQTTDQIVRRIKGTRARQYRDGILEIDRRHVEAITRTAINHVSSRAKDDLYAENSDIIKGVKWNSVIDSRTSPICRSRDNKIYPVNSGPRPPAHFNCRSQVVPFLGASNIPGLRASATGQIPDDLSYGDWLRKQSVEIQNDVLGVKKAQLFRKGNLPIERFSDNTGREYTLSELKRRDSETWNKVFKEE